MTGLTTNIHTNTIWRLPHTYLLLAGIGLGWVGLIVAIGWRWSGVVAGLLLSGSMILAWAQVVTQTLSSANILEPEVFRRQLAELQTLTRRAGIPHFPISQAFTWAEQTHRAAHRIVTLDPTLTGDLLETLFTVVALLRQVIETQIAQPQVQTPSYQTPTQQRLDASYERLRHTNEQMQILHDQLVVGTASTTLVPLQIVIDLNKTALQLLPDQAS
ncbi:MAG: hypothetical protein NW237_02315 [Cyanobacteriota bacterium]|nr:hypothetical protein [Cyanobacteriota bacterium]